MDGSEGPSALEARRFGEAVARQLGLPVEYWDERLTTTAANRVLLEADLSRARRKAVVDRVAAALILQGWLDAHRAGAHGDEPGRRCSAFSCFWRRWPRPEAARGGGGATSASPSSPRPRPARPGRRTSPSRPGAGPAAWRTSSLRPAW